MGLSVLIVDDNSELCETLADILEMAGFDVKSAEGGEEGIKKVKERFFDVVLMDIKLSGMNGVDAFKAIKKISPKTRAIMMTAYAVDELIEEALNECAFAVLNKPFDMDKLLELIKSATKARDCEKAENDAMMQDAGCRIQDTSLGVHLAVHKV